MSEMQTKVAEIKEGVALLNRHMFNIADAAGQLESRKRYAQEALKGQMGERTALEAVANYCPDPQTIETWRSHAEGMGEAIIRDLDVLGEQIEKEVALREALSDDLP